MEKRIRDSKKAIFLIVAIVNLNVVFFATPLIKCPVELATSMITAILFLVGVYTGVQGSLDYRASNNLNINSNQENKNHTENKKEEKIIYTEYISDKKIEEYDKKYSKDKSYAPKSFVNKQDDGETWRV